MKKKNVLTNPLLIGTFLAMPFTACSSDNPGSMDTPTPTFGLTSIPNSQWLKSLGNYLPVQSQYA